MKCFQHILCPTDFSPAARQAQDLAVALADDLQSKLTLFHAVEDTVYSPWPAVPQPEFVAERRRLAKQAMAAIEAEIGSPRRSFVIGEGAPHHAIVRAAAESGADLVVMGTHGRAGVEKLILGSTTEKALHLLNVPVLTVNPATMPDVSSRGAGERFLTLLLAVDLGPGTVATAEHALVLARHYRSRIVVVHAYPRPLEMSHQLASAWFQTVELDRAATKLKLDRLVPSSVREVCPTEIEIRDGEPFDVIREVARETGADLVVMGAHRSAKSGLGWLGSTAHKMIRAACCPILAVRRGA